MQYAVLKKNHLIVKNKTFKTSKTLGLLKKFLITYDFTKKTFYQSKHLNI